MKVSTLGVVPLVAALASALSMAACGDDDSGGATLGEGPYAIVYTGTFAGVDGRTVDDGKATFDGLTLTGYTAAGQESDEAPLIGTNTAKDVAGGPLFAVGRWSGGITEGKFYNVGAAGKMTFAENGGFHYAIGKSSDPIPSSGPATYTIESKTAATVADGSQAPGTIGGSLVVNLAGASTKVAFSVTIDIPGSGTYTAESAGGTADPSQSDVILLGGGGGTAAAGAFTYNGNVTNAGAACDAGSCAVGVSGVILGPDAESVVMAVHFFSGAGGSPSSVSGVLAFKK